MNEFPVAEWLDRFSSPIVRIGVILGVTMIAAFTLEWGYQRVFRRLARRTSTGIDDSLYELLHPAIRNTVILLGVSVCVPLLGAPPVIASALLNVTKSVAILVWTAALIRVFSTSIRYVGATGRVSYLQPRTVPLFDTLQKVIIVTIAVYLVFVAWGIDVTGWVASAGIVGIAVGFAAKDTLANLFSGVFILVDAPYRIGDMIVLDSGERGRVTDVGIRSTRILTRDDVEITIPNSAIGAAKISNESGGPHRKQRIDVPVGVAYSSDVGRVREILLEVAHEIDVVCEHPEPRARFRVMGESSLDFSILFWIDSPEDRGRAVDAVNTRILERFREAGIEIPFPQRVVHMPPGMPPVS